MIGDSQTPKNDKYALSHRWVGAWEVHKKRKKGNRYEFFAAYVDIDDVMNRGNAFTSQERAVILNAFRAGSERIYRCLLDVHRASKWPLLFSVNGANYRLEPVSQHWELYRIHHKKRGEESEYLKAYSNLKHASHRLLSLFAGDLMSDSCAEFTEAFKCAADRFVEVVPMDKPA